MLNIDKVKAVYLSCGVINFRKSIDGLTILVENQLRLDPILLIKLYWYFVISK